MIYFEKMDFSFATLERIFLSFLGMIILKLCKPHAMYDYWTYNRHSFMSVSQLVSCCPTSLTINEVNKIIVPFFRISIWKGITFDPMYNCYRSWSNNNYYWPFWYTNYWSFWYTNYWSLARHTPATSLSDNNKFSKISMASYHNENLHDLNFPIARCVFYKNPSTFRILRRVRRIVRWSKGLL